MLEECPLPVLLADWVPHLPELVFDHNEYNAAILGQLICRIRGILPVL